MAELRQNTWSLDEWYGQYVAGTTGGYKYGGSMWSWGNSTGGELGQNDATPGARRSSPNQIGSNEGWKLIEATGSSNACFAIKSDGTLWSWGEDDQGMMGQNEDEKFSSPMQIGANTNWAKVHAGRATIGAINDDGELFVWGWNNYGILGQNQGGASNAAPRYSSPTQIPGSWQTISFGYQSAVGVKTNGTLWTWGRGNAGLGLNQGSTIDRSSPTQVGTDTTWVQGRAGENIGSGLKTDGTLWAWGQNQGGALGKNDTNHRSSPAQIPGTWIQYDTSNNTEQIMGGVKSNGQLFMWGRGYSGQLGQGTGYGTWVRRSSPTLIPGSWDVDLDEGGENTLSTEQMCACKKQDGGYYLWGFAPSASGAFGLNDRSPSAPGNTKGSPTQIPGSFTVIRTGVNATFAIKPAGT